MAIRWKQGLLRSWAVTSALWIASAWWFNIGVGGPNLIPLEYDPFKPPIASSQAPATPAGPATMWFEELEQQLKSERHLTEAAWAFGPPIAVLIFGYSVGWIVSGFRPKRDDISAAGHRDDEPPPPKL